MNANVVHIPVDLPVLERLRSFRADPAESWSELLERLTTRLETTTRELMDRQSRDRVKGMTCKGVFFPLGTLMRARVNFKTVHGVVHRQAIYVDGERHYSVSGAIGGAVGYQINGWKQWECRRPDDNKWVPIDRLRREARRG